jgi:hypothetical protein
MQKSSYNLICPLPFLCDVPGKCVGPIAVLSDDFVYLCHVTDGLIQGDNDSLVVAGVPNAYYGLALIYRMAGQLDAARQVLETFFTRTVNMKGVDGSPIHREAKNLYKELSTAMDLPKQSH